MTRLLNHLMIAPMAALTILASGCAPQALPQALQQEKTAELPRMTLKFNHVVTRETPKGKAADKFAELVKERSKGRIDVQVFPNSELYKDGEELEALQQGAVQFIAPATDKLGALVPAWEATALPYLFLTDEAEKKFVEPGNAVAKELLDKLREKGMVGLAVWVNGFKHFSSSKRPLITPEDFTGLRFRTSGKPDEAFVKALGGSGVVMALSEAFEGLQQGAIDGQYNSWSNIFTQKFHEVQRYGTIGRGGTLLIYVVATNAKFWDGLDPESRRILSEAMNEATKFGNRIADEENASALEAIKKSGRMELHEQTESEANALAQRADGVFKQWEPRTGKDVIEKLKGLNR